VFIRRVSLVALYDWLYLLVWSVLGWSFHSYTCLTLTAVVSSYRIVLYRISTYRYVLLLLLLLLLLYRRIKVVVVSLLLLLLFYYYYHYYYLKEWIPFCNWINSFCEVNKRKNKTGHPQERYISYCLNSLLSILPHY
jgi:glucan phosphoethanolaminetransferase (alkaline phosphatase superfamily)